MQCNSKEACHHAPCLEPISTSSIVKNASNGKENCIEPHAKFESSQVTCSLSKIEQIQSETSKAAYRKGYTNNMVFTDESNGSIHKLNTS